MLPNEKACVSLKTRDAEHLTSTQPITFTIRKAEPRGCDIRKEKPPYSQPPQARPLLPLPFLADLQGAPDLHLVWKGREPGVVGAGGEGWGGK